MGRSSVVQTNSHTEALQYATQDVRICFAEGFFASNLLSSTLINASMIGATHLRKRIWKRKHGEWYMNSTRRFKSICSNFSYNSKPKPEFQTRALEVNRAEKALRTLLHKCANSAELYPEGDWWVKSCNSRAEENLWKTPCKNVGFTEQKSQAVSTRSEDCDDERRQNLIDDYLPFVQQSN